MSELEQAQVVADHHMRVDVVAFPLLVGRGAFMGFDALLEGALGAV